MSISETLEEQKGIFPKEIYMGEFNLVYGTEDFLDEKIRNTNFIIFGTGTTGGDIATMLAQIGAENITILDMDNLDASNLNRQHGKYYDIGRSKVDIIADDIYGINPYISVNAVNKRIIPEDVNSIINSIKEGSSSIIFWEMDDRDSFIQAHFSAKEKGIPIFMLTDIGHSVYCLTFLYNQKESRLFNGKTDIENAKKMSFLELMAKFIPINSLPLEYLEVVSEMMSESRDTVPQVTTASKKAGAIACETIISYFENKKIKEGVMHNTMKNQLTKFQKFIDMTEKINYIYRLGKLKKQLSKRTNKKSSF